MIEFYLPPKSRTFGGIGWRVIHSSPIQTNGLVSKLKVQRIRHILCDAPPNVLLHVNTNITSLCHSWINVLHLAFTPDALISGRNLLVIRVVSYIISKVFTPLEGMRKRKLPSSMEKSPHLSGIRIVGGGPVVCAPLIIPQRWAKTWSLTWFWTQPRQQTSGKATFWGTTSLTSHKFGIQQVPAKSCFYVVHLSQGSQLQ